MPNQFAECRMNCCCPRILVRSILALLIGGAFFVSGLQAQGLIRSIAPKGEFIQQALPSRQTVCNLVPGDQLWVISSRDVVTGENCGQFRVGQYADGGYQASNLEALSAELALRPDIPTMVYVHGNFTDFGWALQRGCEVYNELFSGCGCRKSVRFIVWSWKTEREAGPVADFDAKVCRSVEEGSRLLSVMNDSGIQSPLVVGYSLGCQVILSALTQPENTNIQPWRVAMMAPALDCDFAPTLSQFPLTLDRVPAISVFTNGRDRALKYSRLRCQLRNCPDEPLDQYSVIPWLSLGGVEPQVCEISPEVGRRHSISRYISSPTVLTGLRRLINDDSIIYAQPVFESDDTEPD